jgi:hypothetical protein
MYVGVAPDPFHGFSVPIPYTTGDANVVDGKITVMVDGFANVGAGGGINLNESVMSNAQKLAQLVFSPDFVLQRCRCHRTLRSFLRREQDVQKRCSFNDLAPTDFGFGIVGRLIATKPREMHSAAGASSHARLNSSALQCSLLE